jgi:catechol 2,3-dioxygenase-like lactoylglutathione lyase family enzyme
MISGIRFVRVTVTDIDSAKDFYVNKLGFRVLVEMPLPGGNQFVMVTPASAGTSLVFSMPMPGQEHVAFSNIAFETDDVRATHKELVAEGVEFLKPPAETPWGGVEAVFADPFDNNFMLQQGGM